MKTTAKAIIKLIYDRIEDTETPRRFLDYLKTREGKKLTKRDLPALQAIEKNARFRSIAGMTSLDWGGYGRHDIEGHGGSLLLTHGDMVCDSAKVERLNTHFWPGAIERNEKRAKALADTKTLEACAKLVDTINEATAALQKLVEYDGPLDVARSDIEKLVKS